MLRISQLQGFHLRIHYLSHVPILIPILLALRMLNLQMAIALAFHTDAGRERDLQAWVASGDITTSAHGLGDDDTFGPGANDNTSWDQFSANKTLFGVKASFDEDVYTTKLDRSAPDFKEVNEKPNILLMKLSEVLPTTPTLQKNEG